MSLVVIAVLALLALCLVCGAILGFAAVHFRVEGDPIAEQINALLHLVFGKAPVKICVAHFCPPVLKGQTAADHTSRRLNVAPKFGVVGPGCSNEDAVGTRVKCPSQPFIGLRQ